MPQHRGAGLVEHRKVSPPLPPGARTHRPLLQGERQNLLGKDVPRRHRRLDRFDPALRPAQQQAARLRNGIGVQAQEQTVAGRSGAPAGPAEPLQERGDGPGRVELDHPVQVADVDAELQCGGGDDDAVAPVGEGGLGPAAFGRRQRGV